MPTRPTSRANFMPLLRALIVSAAALVISTSISQAGPCSPALGRVQADVDAYLEARASAGVLRSRARGRSCIVNQPLPPSPSLRALLVTPMLRRLKMLFAR